jgi:hypothetical protein
MSFLLFSFFYLKHYQKVKGFNYECYKTDYMYFNDVTEDEKIEIEHKDRVRLQGIDMEKPYFHDYWVGGFKTAI